jgi:denticleless
MLKCDPVCGFGGHRNSTFYVKTAVSPGGRYLLSGSSCSRAFIWDIEEPCNPPLVLSGHKKEVTAVCWSPAFTEVVTCSDNNDLRIWRIKRKKGMDRSVGTIGPYHGEGHTKARESTKKLSAKNSAITSSRTPLHMQTTRTTVRATKRKASGISRNQVLQIHNYFSKTEANKLCTYF